MSHIIRAVTGAALASILVGLSALWAPVAHAGGPTSVLLAAPSQSQVTALHHSEAVYDQLRDQVGAIATPGEGPEVENSTEPYQGAFNLQVRLTWMIHDMQVWRQDIIHLDTPGGWVIETRELSSDGTLSKPRFHRPTDRAALQAVLTRVGINTDIDAALGHRRDHPKDPESPHPSSTPAAGAEVDRSGSLGDPGTTSAALIGVGFGGLIIGAVGYHLIDRRRRDRGEPDRIELHG